jgi:hypothetical protein
MKIIEFILWFDIGWFIGLIALILYLIFIK